MQMDVLNAVARVLFVGAAALLTFPASGQSSRLTSQQVIDRIKGHVGVDWHEPTVDTFKAGDPQAPVTGIAVVMMSTLDVLQRAAAAGSNLIITHEPTFYDHNDRTSDLEAENDAVLAAKQAFIKSHGLVIWRFHDYWHRRRPDGIQTGMVHKLGWTGASCTATTRCLCCRRQPSPSWHRISRSVWESGRCVWSEFPR